MCHSSGKSQWTSPEFLFIQSKTIGNVASVECHHLSEKTQNLSVNTELKLLVYMCSIIFEHFGIWGVFVCYVLFWVFFKDQRGLFVLYESLLHKSILVARGANSALPVAVFSQELACNGTGALFVAFLHVESGAVGGRDWGFEKQRTMARVAQTESGSSQLWNCWVWRAKAKCLCCLSGNSVLEDVKWKAPGCSCVAVTLQSPWHLSLGFCIIFISTGDGICNIHQEVHVIPVMGLQLC